MQYDDQLPCGGYENEDAKIKQQLKQISEGKECCRDQCSKGCKKVDEEEVQITIKTFCKKCAKGRAILLHKGDPICQQCLFKNMQYKCRLMLQNTFKVKKESNLLVCLSGGLNSICLLNIVSNIMKRYQKNKLFNTLGCIHVQQQKQLPANYCQMFEEKTGIKLQVIKLQSIFGKQGTSLQDVTNVLGMFNKNANTIDLINIFRDRLILDFAKKNGYDYILKGSNGQVLAAQTFKYFAKGLGGNIPLLSPTFKEKCPFYYPLKNNLQKQIQYYYHINRLAEFAIKWEQQNVQYFVTTGLDGQIKQFIDNLQNMYSHTAPAIVRTSEKIQTNLQKKEPCQWCFMPKDQGLLCRRCQRLWEARKNNIDKSMLPSWMIIE